MSISRWWEGRLREGFPLGQPPIKALGNYNYKLRDGVVVGGWPKAVARSALYDDYGAWFNISCPGATIKTEHEFYVMVRPWVYFDKGKQVKNYFVMQSKLVNGTWVKVRVRRWFIRLGTYEEHCAMFFRDTGTQIASTERSGKEQWT